MKAVTFIWCQFLKLRVGANILLIDINKMFSRESLDQMLNVAKKIDTELLYLEGEVKNPARLRYSDQDENTKKADQCLDLITKELIDMQVTTICEN